MSSSLSLVFALASESPYIRALFRKRPKIPSIEHVEREDQPEFVGPFTLAVLDKSRVIRGTPPPRHWDYYRDGEWDDRDRVDEWQEFKLFYNGHEAPMLPEYRKEIDDHQDRFGDDEWGPRSRYKPESLCRGIVNELNRLWTTLGPLKFLSQYYVRLLEIPHVLKVYRPLINGVLKGRAAARDQVNFTMFRHSKAKGALTTPEEVLDLIARFLGVL